MSILRGVLVLGLVFHKLVWELMKVGDGGAGKLATPTMGTGKRVLKTLKGAALGLLVVQTLVLDLFPISRRSKVLSRTGTALYLLGLAVAVLGRLQLGKNWSNLEDSAVLPTQRLVSSGIYAYIRHPIYVGDLLLLTGLELALNSWLVLTVIVPLLVVLRQANREEALLAGTFGEYEQYRTRTKKYIPLVW